MQVLWGTASDLVIARLKKKTYHFDFSSFILRFGASVGMRKKI